MIQVGAAGTYFASGAYIRILMGLGIHSGCHQQDKGKTTPGVSQRGGYKAGNGGEGVKRSCNSSEDDDRGSEHVST